jgi:hypothetical protein
MRWPAMALAEQRPDWQVINCEASHPDALSLAEKADLLVCFQSADPELLHVVKLRQVSGLPTVVEYNDNFYEPTPSSPVQKAWSSPLIWQYYEDFIRAADLLVVTGEGLRELFSKKFKRTRIHTLKNHLFNEKESFSSLWNRKDTEKITLAWAGSLGHMPDLLAMRPVLIELLELFPQLEIGVMGNKAIPNNLRLPAERFLFQEWGSVQSYLDFLSNAHIAVAPLLDHPYNHCRSDVKAIEMASRAALPILTELTPYREILGSMGAQGVCSHEELFTLLKTAISNPQKLKSRAQMWFDYVRSSRSHQRNTERAELYEELCRTSAGHCFSTLGVGYHELRAGKRAFVSQKLEGVRTCLKNGEREEAAQTVRIVLEESPHDRDALYYGSALGLLSGDELRELSSRMSCDLRFLMLQVERKELGWALLISKLEEGSRPFRDFYAEGVLKLLKRADASFYPSNQELLKLSRMYDNKPELLLLLAGALERNEELEGSSECFERLVEIRELVEQDREFLRSTSNSYLKTWDLALRSRKQKTFLIK